jgi:hypothetical protein
MAELPPATIDRKRIAVRLLYTIFYLVVLEILKLILQAVVLFQYVYLLVTRRTSEPVRSFGNKVSTYAYRVMRYVSLAENPLPFPFSDFPEEIHPPEEPATF